MATAPVYYSDKLVKEYIDKEFAGKTGAELYNAVANEAAKQGVSAEQIGRVLGFNTADVNKYATSVGKPLVAEQKALTDVIDYAYNTQFGRDATAKEVTDATNYLTGGSTFTNMGTSLAGTGALNYSTEGYNYDTQSVISGYRSTLGRNPTQTEYVSAMAKLGYDPFNPAVLGEMGKLSANVAALESDPFAGRYANVNPYGTYDIATMTTKLDSTLPNISKNVSGNVVQFISPVTQRPIVTSFVDGKLVVKDGVNTLTGEQAQSAINLALNTGALTATEYKTLTNSLASAKSMDDVYKAFGTPQAVTALDPKYGFQLGVGKTLAEAQANSTGVQALVDQIASENGGRLPANFSVANLAKTKNVPFQFGQDVYNKSFMTDANTPITTMATSPTVMYNPATPSAPFNFNPANIYQPNITAGQFRELFPSFAESRRLAQGLINERPSTQSIVNMIQGGKLNELNTSNILSSQLPSYFVQNPDVAASYRLNNYGMTPDQFAAAHYQKFGQSEQRAAPTTAVTPAVTRIPTPVFTRAVTPIANPIVTPVVTGANNPYFQANPDVAASYLKNNYGLTPEQFAAKHFELYGSKEQRVSPTGVAPVVPVKAEKPVTGVGGSYFQENPDVAASYLTNNYGLTPDQFAATHYDLYGQNEQRISPTGVVLAMPHTTTSALPAYFTQNPDVAAAYQANNYGLSPTDFATTHYNLYGQAEQRAAPTSLANVISTISN